MRAAPSPPSSTPDPRRILGRVIAGRYRVDEILGEGSAGTVYRAEHVQLGRRVTVKVVHPGMPGAEEAVARFEREAIAGARIEHPNVATAMDLGVLEDGAQFLVVDHVDGSSLRDALARGPMAPDRALRVARQIALGIRAAHEAGVVHGDLRPENVMITPRGDGIGLVRIVAFGMAKVPIHDGRSTVKAGAGHLLEDALAARASRIAALPRASAAEGAPEYMAPELLRGGDVDGRADLYSLGVILYEMLAGQRPFDGADRADLIARVTGAPPPPISSRTPGGPIAPPLEGLVGRLLAKAPGDRFASAAALVDAIDALLVPASRFVVDRQASASAATSPNLAPPPASAPSRPSATARAASRETQVAKYGPNARASMPTPTASTTDRASTVAQDPAADATRAASRAAALSWAGLAAITATIVIAIAMRSPKTVQALEEVDGEATASSARAAAIRLNVEPSAAPKPSAAAESSQTAPSWDLDTARLTGLPALGPLAVKYPNDPAVLKALMLAHAAGKSGYASALGVAKKLFEISPKTAGDEDMRRTLLRIANGPTDVATLALEAMAEKMGAFGPDMLYEIATDPSMGRFPRDRAGKLLDSAAVRKAASPALLIAMDLKPLKPCARKALFARARDDGDARSLPYLKPFVITDGCAKMIVVKFDCNPCLGDRADLNEAIKAIEARGAKR